MNAYRLTVLITSLFMAGAAATQLTAAPKTTAPITVTVTGLGCVTSLGDDSFEARSWSWGATNTATDLGSGGGSGKAVIAALALSRVSDGCSPDLLGGVVTGKHFPAFTLSQFDKDGVLKATVVLSDAILTSWQVGGTNTSAEATEEVQVSFRKLTFTDVASGKKFSWDVAGSKTF
jgi:type VI secretion system secreted protein Hcp